MEIIKTDDFIGQLRKLPVEIRYLYERQEAIFLRNQFDHRLHLKRILMLEGVYSFRITRRYRCLFYFQSKEVVVFFTIGHRKDIYH
ncbi:MAG: hypothetical protein HY481_00435 [Candidatus Vogelbacteria bacterium]|nr:hypothetical protein [Candidatus Vogelbacteria bacterium]